MCVVFDGALHGDATVEDDINEGRDVQDIGNGSESRVFTKLMAGEGTVILYEAFGLHIFKGGLLRTTSVI